MKGVIQIARVFGIPVQLHWTFGLLIIAGAYFAYAQSWHWLETAWAAGLVLVLFTCVVLHEFGHALTARRFGVDTRDIILSPIGGVARLDHLPEHPYQEFLVAVAGPMVNLGIAVVPLPYLFANTDTRRQILNFFDRNSNAFFVDLSPFDDFLIGIFLLNVILAIFNLLPAFPMDGGRILRALLSWRLGRMKATRIAAFVGQILAVAFVAYGFWQWSPVTAFIGFFVFVTASSENRMVQLDGLLQEYQVRDIVRKTFTRVYQNAPMEYPIEEITHGLERNFLVFDEWQNMTGTLGEEQLMKAVRAKDFGAPVTTYMNRHYEALLPEDSLKTALTKIQRHNYDLLPVYENHRLVGVIDLHAINHFLKRHKKGKKEQA